MTEEIQDLRLALNIARATALIRLIVQFEAMQLGPDMLSLRSAETKARALRLLWSWHYKMRRKTIAEIWSGK